MFFISMCQLYIIMSFRMAFSYMYIMYFSHIFLYYSPLLPSHSFYSFSSSEPDPFHFHVFHCWPNESHEEYLPEHRWQLAYWSMDALSVATPLQKRIPSSPHQPSLICKSSSSPLSSPTGCWQVWYIFNLIYSSLMISCMRIMYFGHFHPITFPHIPVTPTLPLLFPKEPS